MLCIFILYSDWDTSEVVNIPLLETVTRFTFACILKHSGLLPAALKNLRWLFF